MGNESFIELADSKVETTNIGQEPYVVEALLEDGRI